MSAGSLADRLHATVSDSGPIPVDAYVEAALYDDVGGFYATEGRAGRRGDFLTAPEVGPLFGAVVAGALDRWWIDAGRPDPYTVVDWGAGPGTLARAVLAARPEVLTAGALRWHLVERAATQRAAHPTHEAVISASSVDLSEFAGVILANELLDNLAFDILERRDGHWHRQLVGPRDDTGRFGLVTGEVVHVPGLEGLVPGTEEGTMVPWQPAARRWLADALAMLGAGRVIVFDYGASTAVLAGRRNTAEEGPGWLRTHRHHSGSADWRRDPGGCDITADVAFDQLQSDRRADVDRSQADWLAAHGIAELVEEGRRIWQASAGVGDLAALKARSRIREAEALTDPAGMGAFRVLEWVV
jgi:SAM-dependent MidA family methyltransferase